MTIFRFAALTEAAFLKPLTISCATQFTRWVQAYSTFLQGGPWVFVTDHHTKGASKLWDSLVTGNNINLYVSAKTGELLDPAMHHEWTDLRLLGPKDRFKLN